MKKITFALITLASILFSNSYCQDLFNSNNLSTVNVDKLTDDQIDQVKSQLANKGENIDQVKPLVISKGMSEIEFNKLKTRLNTVKDSEVINILPTIEPEKKEEQSIIQETSPTDPLIFGSELFTNPSLNFEPNNKIATPVNYILGPNDRLQISVYGIQEFSTETEVSSEGGITIPHVGYISVIGMTIESATQKIKKAISKVYSTVNSGQSQVTVNITQIRTIKITIIGGQQPGNYSVSSLTTVFNALHLAGGAGNNGSFRNIELIRNNKIIRTVDIYNYLINGDQSDNIGLKENDLIRIPAYSKRVSLVGEIKRPGLYELKSTETLSDLLQFCSGFNSDAHTASINVIQKTNKEYKISDISSSNYNLYIPSDGDEIRVSKILNQFENRLQVNGAIARPDTYSYTDGMRLLDLINIAGGLKDDAYIARAKILRLNEDHFTEIIQINLKNAIEGDPLYNILLKKEDILSIYSKKTFDKSSTISIYGEIKIPGNYPFVDQITLNDLIIEAGGLIHSSSTRIEISRAIITNDIEAEKQIEIINIDITPENNEQAKNISLSPFDIINVRKIPNYSNPRTITIKGAVVYPGLYVLTNNNEKIYDIVLRAGGLTSFANIESVKIKRKIQEKEIENLINSKNNISDSIQIKIVDKITEDLKYLTIPINWAKVQNHPKNSNNILLEEDDIVEISLKNGCVKVMGNVVLNSEIPYKKRKNIKFYINSVGGLNSKGQLKKSYIIYANGNASATKSFLGIKSYPKVAPGSQIIVPEKPDKQRKSVSTEILAAVSVFTSLAGIIITIMKITETK